MDEKEQEKAAEQAAAASNESLAESARANAAQSRLAGCSPAILVLVGAIIAVVVGLAVLIFANSSTCACTPPTPAPPAETAVSSLTAVAPSERPSAGATLKAPTAAVTSEPTSAASLANFDGDWMLVSGLRNVNTDYPLSCNACTGYDVTIDDPVADIQVSGTQITGGQYKVGYTATLAGDKCPYEQQSKIDGSVSGGVDLVQAYGQLIIDGPATRSVGCDENYKPLTQAGPEHMSRNFYIAGDTLYLCQGLNATYSACVGPNGCGTVDPVATFQR